MSWRVIQGQCVAVMAEMSAASVDAIVTDPPYGLGFMGRAWDDLPPGVEWAEQCLRVLKPGGHLLAFGGTRTFHRLVCAVEDAGFEIRDTIAWLYGSGFPKSLDVSKAIDKAAGVERTIVGVNPLAAQQTGQHDTVALKDRQPNLYVTVPATSEAERWSGWGTALKPAHEPIVVARKPLSGTIAQTVLEHGCGALNIDGCRIGTNEALGRFNNAKPAEHNVPDSHPNARNLGRMQRGAALVDNSGALGRWPANVVLDERAALALDRQTGMLHSQDPATRRSKSKMQGVTQMGTGESVEYADAGGASRFLYVAKAGRGERNAGGKNTHPTVKPIALMQWLVRLVTLPRGIVLDPFAGSGTTGIAALREGFSFIGIEREAEYVALARDRIIADCPLHNTGIEHIA